MNRRDSICDRDGVLHTMLKDIPIPEMAKISWKFDNNWIDAVFLPLYKKSSICFRLQILLTSIPQLL